MHDSEFKNDLSGTTAVVVVVDASTNELFIAHVGDSRAIVVCGGKVLFATRDHKPETPLERQRIEEAGGSLFCAKKLCSSTDDCTHPLRVKYLAMSRAIGDRLVKDSGVTADPDVKKVNIAEDVTVILASDGLWDFVENDQVASIVYTKLNEPGGEEDNAVKNVVVDENGDKLGTSIARELVEEAHLNKRRGDISDDISDDISVVVLQIGSSSSTTRSFKSISINKSTSLRLGVKNTILGSAGVVMFCCLYQLGYFSF